MENYVTKIRRELHSCPGVGFELDEWYYTQAKERLEAEQAQMSLFDGGEK